MALNRLLVTPDRVRRRPRRIWSRLHFGIRFLGLTGLLLACVGLVLAHQGGVLATWDKASEALSAFLRGERVLFGVYLIGAGVLAGLVMLLVEALAALRFAAGRRGVVGFNAGLQIALVAVLVVGVNFVSFRHYLRWDWTRKNDFTLPAELEKQLAQLKDETTIIVYQRHKTFGALTDKPDRYDYAAERKVVEKVKDLVDQFRELGPRFRVVVLDVEEKGFDEKLRQLTKGAPELKKAIDAASENTLFFASDGKVQHLSFNEFYQLDKVASEKDDNLILLAQGAGGSGRGIEPFARKILNTEERRPRVGILVVHELLTTEGSEDAFNLKGLRKTLETNGFDVRDVVLRKGWETGALEAAADTIEESKLERLDVELEELDASIKPLEHEIAEYGKLATDWSLPEGADPKPKLEELTAKYVRQLRGIRVTEALRRQQVRSFQTRITRLREILDDLKLEREETRKDRGKIDVDRVTESRRMTDMRAKLARTLADCDLLFIPRLTRRANGGFVPNRAHKIEEEQVSAIKECLQAGKPVFACLGPINEPRDAFAPEPPGADALENMFAELGIRLGKQTVLFNADAKAFAADRRSNPLRAGGTAKLPALDFDSPTDSAAGAWIGSESPNLPPNPLREGLRVTAHSVGDNFDLRVRFPRPIYVDPDKLKNAKVDPIFILTADGWNDDQPFPTRERIPRYDPPKDDDPAKGTPDAKRRGAFPIGVALETALPPSWSPDGTKLVRLAVIGQGELFVGNELPAPRERLFLQTANWLLGRDDYLPRADHPWSYPRIELTPKEKDLWLWGVRLGLPVLCAYFGWVVLLARQLR